MNRLIGHILLWLNILCFGADVVIAINYHRPLQWVLAFCNLVVAIMIASRLDLLD